MYEYKRINIKNATAKPMYLVDELDNKELLKEIVIETCKSLTNKK